MWELHWPKFAVRFVLTTVANGSITELLFIAGLSVPRNLKDVLCLIDKCFYRVEITPKTLLLPKFIEKSHISVAVDVNFYAEILFLGPPVSLRRHTADAGWISGCVLYVMKSSIGTGFSLGTSVFPSQLFQQNFMLVRSSIMDAIQSLRLTAPSSNS